MVSKSVQRGDLTVSVGGEPATIFRPLSGKGSDCSRSLLCGPAAGTCSIAVGDRIVRVSAFSFGSEVEHGKPFPDIFLNAASRLNVNPNMCIVFEDSEPGLIAAKAAGMRSIFIKDMVSPSEEAETVNIFFQKIYWKKINSHL